MTTVSTTLRERNGSAMAAFLGAGIGAFAMGAVVILNEAGISAAPTLYAPAGGISGRTTLEGPYYNAVLHAQLGN